MSDYSKMIAEIRDNNERLKRQDFQRKQEEEEMQQKEMIRDWTISFLLYIIQGRQTQDEKVTNIGIYEKKKPLEYKGKNPFPLESEIWIFYEKGKKNLERLPITPIWFVQKFGVENIREIYEAFGLGESKTETKVLEGFFTISLEKFGCKEAFQKFSDNDFYFQWETFMLKFAINY